jgi:hypothetical protein
MTKKNGEVRPSNLTIMHALDNFASFYLIHLKYFFFLNIFADATRSVFSAAIFHDICIFFSLFPPSQLNRPLRICKTIKRVIKLDPL